MRRGITVDLSTDVAFEPDPGMRQAMADAELGDDQRREDPTVNRLEERVAALLDKEAALFVPSGTMANILALFVLCNAGDEVLVEASSHLVLNEGGGPAIHSRVSLVPVPGSRGVFASRAVADLGRPGRYGGSRLRCVCVENTHTRAGGTVWPLHATRAVQESAAAAGAVTHLDGARLFNAVAAGEWTAAELCAGFTSVTVSLAKGLGAPAGALIAGDRAFVEDLRRARKLFGGAIARPGVLAAAGLYALDHNLGRLAHDNARAHRFAERVGQIEGVLVDLAQVQTNIVLLDVTGTGIAGGQLLDAMAASSTRIGWVEEGVMRAVMHGGITDQGAAKAVDALDDAISSLRPERPPRPARLGRPQERIPS